MDMNRSCAVMDDQMIKQHVIFTNVVTAIKNGNTSNLPILLEILNINNNTDVQIKIFSFLSACLMLNNTVIEAIVTFTPVYVKICEVLAKCPPRKATVAFDFISALLYVTEEDSHKKKCLVAYARNMIRSSGCLAALCDLFTSCMMPQDAWRSLCRCLAEVCRGAEANQSYCAHLVPMCIQRCSLKNIEVLLVLQSLLQNHNRNIDLFVECNGISLFQRSFLQHDACMQLLATITQSSTQAVALIVKTNICQQLREFLHLYGAQSQIGQWATIVLYHTSRIEASCGSKIDQLKKVNDKINESHLSKKNPAIQKRELECSTNTTNFFQNVMKEIIQCGDQKELNKFKAVIPTDIRMNRRQRNLVNSAAELPLHEITQKHKESWSISLNNHSACIPNNAVQTDTLHNKTKELSFSFLRKLHLGNGNSTSKFASSSIFPGNFTEQKILQTNDGNVRHNTNYESHIRNNESRSSTVNTNDFKPNFASTPKKVDINEYSKYGKPVVNNIKSRLSQIPIRNHQIKRRSEKLTRNLKANKIVKEIKHRSLSGRFFDAINTSCTTLVKTVKNIFRPKTNSGIRETKFDSFDKTSNRDTLSCSYSFTNYMRKRDAALKNECTSKSSDRLVDSHSKRSLECASLEMTNSCNTCNDTISLKHKLDNNDHLKRTIRKLKLGINLYGCDFKKISRVIWPNETYMTPAVLYNLYRKLIIK